MREPGRERSERVAEVHESGQSHDAHDAHHADHADRADHGDQADRGLRRILAVGLEPALYGRIEALLNRSYFEVDQVPRGENGRVLCAAIAFDLVLVRFPLPDIDVTDLLAALRVPTSPCARSQILLLADAPRLFQAERLVGQGANAAVATDKTGEYLSGFAAQLLAVPPRVASRSMVRLQARIAEGGHQAFCQTYDISRSGMFVLSDAIYPLGSTVGFDLLLPGEREAVVGRADVVRHAAGGGGKPDGIGLRYIDFRAGSEARLTAFLDRMPAASEP